MEKINDISEELKETLWKCLGKFFISFGADLIDYRFIKVPMGMSVWTCRDKNGDEVQKPFRTYEITSTNINRQNHALNVQNSYAIECYIDRDEKFMVHMSWRKIIK